MAEETKLEAINVPALSGGISQQPAELRFPHQVEDAVNAVFSVADGMRKRPGTVYGKKITGLTAGHGYRAHGIDRDGDEKYLIVYGNPAGTVQLFAYHLPSGTAATVNIDADAQAYLDLNNPAPSELRLRTVGDYTIIVNATVETALIASEDYTLTRAHRDYVTMLSHTPADGTYHRTMTDDEDFPAGYWFYDVGGATFAKIRFADLQDFGAGGWADLKAWTYDDDDLGFTANPAGLTIGFQRFAVSGGGFTWTEATRLLTKAGAFTGLVGKFGDQINITGGTSVTADWYPIEQVIDENTIKLLNSPTGGTDQSDLTVDGIGREFEISADFRNIDARSLHDIAREWQNAFWRAGAYDALVSWESEGSGNGHFVVTSPYRGSGAKIHWPTPPTQSRDFTDQHTDPFYSIGITAISAGSPTQITTDRAHDLENGKVVTIYDTNSTPPLSGQYTVTKVDATKFTVPVNVTGAGTTGRVLGPGVVRTDGTGDLASLGVPDRLAPAERWTQRAAPAQAKARPDPAKMPVQMVRTSEGPPATFTVSRIDWVARFSGDQHSNPGPKILQEEKAIRDLAVIRDRLFLVGESYIDTSQSGDLFNLFGENARNVVDSDPINISLSSGRVTRLDFIAPFRDSASLFTLAGQQFELSSPEVFTPTSVSATESTAFKTFPVRPQAMGNLLYFAADADGYAAIQEYFFDDFNITTTANDVTEHVRELLPTDIQTIAVHPNSGTVIAIPEGATTIYPLSVYFNARRQREQTAWSKIVFDDSYRISDGAVVGNDLWLVVESESQYVLERLPLGRQAPDSGMTFTPHIDRRMAVTGVHANGTTTWTLPDSLSDTTIDTIVRGSSFGSDAGKPVTVDTAGGTTVTAVGDFSAGPCYLGRSFDLGVTLSKPFLRDDRGHPDLHHTLLGHYLHLTHKNSGPYTVRLDFDDARADVTASLSVTAGAVATGRFSPSFNVDLDHTTVSIESSDPRPVVITGLQYIVEPIDPMR